MPKVEVPACDAAGSWVAPSWGWGDWTAWDLCVGISSFKAHTNALLGCQEGLLCAVYSCCIIAFCCPQGWQRDREYCKSSRSLLFMSHQINQWSAAGVWSRVSAECTPRPWILLAKLLWCPSLLFIYKWWNKNKTLTKCSQLFQNNSFNPVNLLPAPVTHRSVA